MEELYAELLLCYIGFHFSDRYNALLASNLLSNPENEMYLKLEDGSSDSLNSVVRFKRYWDYECGDFHCDLFGKQLFSGLKAAYDTHAFEISDFGNRCSKLWHMLPDSVSVAEPFYTLSYADDPLSWGDEVQTRELYEKVFTFYDNEDSVP